MKNNVCEQVFGKSWSELTPEERILCNRYRRRVSYFRNQARNSEKQRLQKRLRKEELLDLLGWPAECMECGYSRYIGALDFHHLDAASKDNNVLKLGREKSIQEAKKCRLLCANCHREAHSKDNKGYSRGRPRVKADPLLEKYMRASGCTEEQIAEALRGRK